MEKLIQELKKAKVEVTQDVYKLLVDEFEMCGDCCLLAGGGNAK